MEKGFKECPFCANEIKEGAIKCQYCHEFLNKDVEENDNKKNLGASRYKNKWIWSVLGIIIIIIIVINTSRFKTWHLFNKVENIVENSKSYDDIKKDLDNVKKNTPEEEAAFKELGELIDDFYNKNASLDENLFFLDTTDYKDTNKIQQAIDNWNLRDKYFKEYSNNVDNLFKKYKSLDDTGNGTYSLTTLSKKIKDLSNSVSIFTNKYVNFYNYILTVQEDFYVESDGQIYFYDGGNEMDKYNQLSNEIYNATIKYIEDVTKYSDYMEKYDKYRGM